MGLCGGGQDDGSAQMRQQEAERQARIREGTNRINSIFGGDITKSRTAFSPVAGQEVVPGTGFNDRGGMTGQQFRNILTQVPHSEDYAEKVPGQFTDDFYHNLENNYLDYYKPQLSRQETDADRNLKINLARSGNLTGSVGARQIGRLAEDKATQERALSDNALKYSNDARTKNEGTRANLIGQLENGAGIENVANQASAAAQTATAPSAFSPLGDLFKNYSAAVANASIAAGNPTAFPGAQQYRNSLLFNAGGNNSATVVN